MIIGGRVLGFFSKISEGLKKTRDSLGQLFDGVFSGGSVNDELFDDLEEALVLGDTGAATAAAICEELRKRVKKDGVTDPEKVREMLAEVIAEMLRGGQELNLESKPAIIMVIGVNGAGKTTTIGKLAKRFEDAGKKVVVAAADTFRAAIEQLEVWAQRSGAEIIKHSEGSDPAAVVFDAIAAGKARHADIIICDTAGRLHNKKGLMDELAKIGRVIEREAAGSSVETLLVLDATTGQNALNQAREFGRIIEREAAGSSVETLLVLDATTGQNALNQAREFGAACGITGIVLTKLDGTARGGVVIGIKQELGIPIKFIGVGEQADDLQPFDPDAFAKALFE